MSQPTGGGSTPNYMGHVLSRFGHHLSPMQRTFLSSSVNPLQSAKQASFSYYDNSINEHNTSSCTIPYSKKDAFRQQQHNPQQSLGFTKTVRHQMDSSSEESTINTSS